MTSGTTHRRAVIFHGYGATPGDHWFAWLAEQLEADGIPTTVPALSRPLEPDPARWEAEVHTALGTPDAKTIVVAHSLGCLTVLRYLASLPSPWRLDTLVLVSGFVDPLPALPALDTYIAAGCDVTGMREHVRNLVVIRSDDDPFVPPVLTNRLADLLGVGVRVVPTGGHFLASDGFTDFAAAFEAIVN